jgi:predicted DNA-binding transcriptional regulator AlpA
MSVRIDLPIGDLIEYSDLARAMAQARIRLKGVVGIDCITGKMLTCHPQQADKGVLGDGARQSDSAERVKIADLLLRTDRKTSLFFVDENSGVVDLLAEAEAAGDATQGGLTLPFKLTDEDRAQVEQLLPALPALIAPLSGEDCLTFMAAYRSHPDRLAWEPILLPVYDPEAQQSRLEMLCAQYCQVLRDDFNSQKFMACDRSRNRVSSLDGGTFIPRRVALDYLKQWHDLECDAPFESDAKDASTSPAAKIVGLADVQTSTRVREVSSQADQAPASQGGYATYQPSRVIQNGRVLRMDDLVDRSGLSRATLYSIMDPKSRYFDPKFPKKIQLASRSVGYLEADVDAWIQARVNSAEKSG